MLQKVYLNLIILCGFLSPGIFKTFLDDNYGNFTNVHCRKKRMLEHNADALFITKIIFGYQVICAGAIVSPGYVLSAEACHVVYPRGRYFIVSGVQHLGTVNHHSIRHMWRGGGDLVLFELKEPINFINPSMNRPMPFYETNVTADLPYLNNYSWNSYDQGQTKTRVSIVDRATNPSLRHDQIVTDQMHGHRRTTSDAMDIGSPLAVGHHLVGILVTQETTRDIFTLVHIGTEHYTWVMEHIHEDLQNLVNTLNHVNHK